MRATEAIESNPDICWCCDTCYQTGPIGNRPGIWPNSLKDAFSLFLISNEVHLCCFCGNFSTLSVSLWMSDLDKWVGIKLLPTHRETHLFKQPVHPEIDALHELQEVLRCR